MRPRVTKAETPSSPGGIEARGNEEMEREEERQRWAAWGSKRGRGGRERGKEREEAAEEEETSQVPAFIVPCFLTANTR